MAAAAPVAALALAPEAVKLASSITAHVAAALGTPLLHLEETRTRATKRGITTQRTGISVPAWAAVAAGALFLWATAPSRGSSGNSGLGWYSFVPFGGLLKEWGLVKQP